MTLRTFPLARATFAVVLGALLLVQPGTTATEPDQTVQVGRRARAYRDWSRDERRLMWMQNKVRRARGLQPMRWRRSLSAIARSHSRTMRAAGDIFHSTLSGPIERFRWSIAGENVGVGPTIGSLYQAFMNSPGHRANILHRSYNRQGVGVVLDGSTIYVTIVFMG